MAAAPCSYPPRCDAPRSVVKLLTESEGKRRSSPWHVGVALIRALWGGAFVPVTIPPATPQNLALTNSHGPRFPRRQPQSSLDQGVASYMRPNSRMRGHLTMGIANKRYLTIDSRSSVLASRFT